MSVFFSGTNYNKTLTIFWMG